MSDGLGNEVLDLGKAIGLFDDGGSLQPHWFENPLNHIESIFTVDTQRAAFLRVLELLAPVQLPGLQTRPAPCLANRPGQCLSYGERPNASPLACWQLHSSDLAAPLPLSSSSSVSFNGATSRRSGSSSARST
jgi:hypothetical protein